jgi:hypothetical protein
MHCKACYAPIEGERKRSYCDDPTCRRQRAKAHTKAHRSGAARRQKKRSGKRPNPSKLVDIPETPKSTVQGAENTTEFRKKIPVFAFELLPINVLGGQELRHRETGLPLTGSRSLTADLLADVMWSECGSLPGRLAKVKGASDYADLINQTPEWLDRIVPRSVEPEPETAKIIEFPMKPRVDQAKVEALLADVGDDGIPNFLRRTPAKPLKRAA